MPYPIRECKTPEWIALEAVRQPPFGPGFSQSQIDRAAKLIVTGTCFNDPGDDWVSFELLDATGKCIAAKRIAGY